MTPEINQVYEFQGASSNCCCPVCKTGVLFKYVHRKYKTEVHICSLFCGYAVTKCNNGNFNGVPDKFFEEN